MPTEIGKINYNPDVLLSLANLSNDEVFTPPDLANNILDLLPTELWSDKNTTFLDPVSKSGVFLREIAKRLMKGLENEIPNQQERINHIFSKQLYGIAITEITSLLSRRSVYCSKTANGKYSICETFDTPEGNIKFNRIEHTWQNGRCIFCGASQETYDRGSELETHAYEFIHTNDPKELFNMKFDVIIGNPPYQLNDGGAGASAIPLYHKFVHQAKKLNPRYLTMIIPSRWFAGGKGLDSFREEMLNDKSLRTIKDYINAKDCFPGISIGGGVCYFLWERDYEGQCQFTNVLNSTETTSLRILNESPVFVRYNDAIKIIHKIKKADSSSLSALVSSRNPFGLSSSARGQEKIFESAIALYSSKGIGYITRDEVTSNIDLIDKYKVMISKVTSEHAGEPDKNGQMKILSRTEILKPNEVCTDSYLIAGVFNTFEEATNLNNYLKTKFTRFLLLQAITSINLSKDKFYFVPSQDFFNNWDDDKLYKKYNLDDDEIKFINSLIKPME